MPALWGSLRPRTSTVTRAVVHFLIASVVALVIVVIAAAVISSRVAKDESETQAGRVTQAVADALEPFLTPEVRAEDPAALQALDAAVRTRVAGTQIVRFKLWAADGTIVYADEPQLVGKKYELDEDDLAVLFNGGVDSSLSDVSRPENRFEQQFAPVVEVYVRAIDTSGTPLLVETYFTTKGLKESQDALARRIAPAVLVPLGLLLLLLLPLAISLARRVERHERERHALVQLAAEASAAERRRVAGELHDGVIQDLSGVGYALAVVDSRLGRSASMAQADVDELRRTVQTTLDVVRGDVSTLRSMITTLYASNFDDVDLAGALLAVAHEVEKHGMTLVADVRPLPEVSDALAGAVFQVGREALRNTIAHSGATTVTMRLFTLNGVLTLVVADDGHGFEQDKTHGVAEGHLGLSLIRDAAGALGGELRYDTAPGNGTVMTLTVPLAQQGGRRSWGRRRTEPAEQAPGGSVTLPPSPGGPTVIDLDRAAGSDDRSGQTPASLG